MRISGNKAVSRKFLCLDVLRRAPEMNALHLKLDSAKVATKNYFDNFVLIVQ